MCGVWQLHGTIACQLLPLSKKKTPQGSGKDSWGGREMVLADPMGVPGPEGFQLAAEMAAKNKRKQKKYHKPS